MKTTGRMPVLLLCAGLLLSADSMAGSGDETLARMGSLEIKRAELERLIGTLPAQPTAEQLLAIDKALRAELMRRALLAQALGAAWDQKPDVRRQIEAAREQVIVTSYMNQQARPAQDYPSEAEIQSVYAENKQKLVRPPQAHLAQIYIKDGGKVDEVSKKAHEKGADFAALSAKYSELATHAQAPGDLGWLALEELAPEYRAAVEKLQPGEISQPIKSAAGWHILKLMAFKESEPIPLSEVRERLVQSLRLQRAQSNERKYLDEMLRKTPITVNEIALSNGVAKGK